LINALPERITPQINYSAANHPLMMTQFHFEHDYTVLAENIFKSEIISLPYFYIQMEKGKNKLMHTIRTAVS
jgi:hypothetical protein